MSCPVTLRRGSLCFARAEVDRFLPGVEAVVLLRDGADLLVLPVLHAHAGGYLLKQRNRAGDRAAHVAGFLRDQGFPDEDETVHEAVFSEERGGLVLPAFFAAAAADKKVCMLHSD